jgi:hypothetical protein
MRSKSDSIRLMNRRADLGTPAAMTRLTKSDTAASGRMDNASTAIRLSVQFLVVAVWRDVISAKIEAALMCILLSSAGTTET